MDGFKLIEHLEKLIDSFAITLVGQVMKRFEILDDTKSQKKAIKELIYEGARGLKSQLKAFKFGIKFITPRKKD